jgi:hypothetical protein
MPGSPQHRIGTRAVCNWGAGDACSEYVVGDVVYVPEGCAAVLDDRCTPGLHRVESVFSIGEDASFYYRVSPTEVVGYRLRTDWGQVSDRLHVIPGRCDFTAGFIRLSKTPERPE